MRRPASHPGEPRRRAAPRRGSAYLLVLIVSMLVVLIGLSGLLNERVRQRAGGAAADQMDSRFLAISAVDLAIFEMKQDVSWRNTYVSGQWQPPRNLGRGTVTYKIVDEGDDDLLNGPTLPVRVYGKGESLDGTQICSVLVGGLGSNIIRNHDIENGTTDWQAFGGATISADPAYPYAGAASLKVDFRFAPTDGVQQDITSKVKAGRSYLASLWAHPSLDTTMRLRFSVLNDGGQTVSFTGDVAANGGQWQQIGGSFTPVWSGNLVAATFRVETASGLSTFWIDEVYLGETIDSTDPIPGTWRQETVP